MPEYIAKTMFGLENILASEIKDLGGSEINTLVRAVSFKGDKKLLYKANYHLRTALKILVPLAEDEIRNETELYEFIRQIKWDRYIGVEDTLAVDVAMNSRVFTHTRFIAQKIKDAVVDQFRDKYGSRPSVDLDNPTLRINAFINNNSISIARDSSGESLHRRGYRIKQGPAPLNEVLAAGMILISGWDKKSPFIDFMCGSGTIPIEAAMLAHDIPPGELRKEYGFMKWKDYEPSLFSEIAGKRPAGSEKSIQIFASDQSADIISLSQRHARNAGVYKSIKFSTGDFADFPPPLIPGIVMVNPPYGERIVQENLNDFYRRLGDKLKKDFPGYQAWILSANAEAMKNVGLHPSPKVILYNGQLECRFCRFSLYAGSKKSSKSPIQ